MSILIPVWLADPCLAGRDPSEIETPAAAVILDPKYLINHALCR